MKRLIPLMLLVLLLSACGSLAPDWPDIGDPMTTGQLVVAFDPIQQGAMLTPGECIDAFVEPIVADALEDTQMRLYYFLDPGNYCLTWGWRTGESSFVVAGERPVSIQAGAITFVSLLPIVEPPIETQGAW